MVLTGYFYLFGIFLFHFPKPKDIQAPNSLIKHHKDNENKSKSEERSKKKKHISSWTKNEIKKTKTWKHSTCFKFPSTGSHIVANVAHVKTVMEQVEVFDILLQNCAGAKFSGSAPCVIWEQRISPITSCHKKHMWQRFYKNLALSTKEQRSFHCDVMFHNEKHSFHARRTTYILFNLAISLWQN